VIVEGRADVLLEQNGMISTISQLPAGQFFGEMSLLTGEPRSATVVAATRLRVIVVEDTLVQLVNEDRQIIERIGEVVARRHASTTAAKEELDLEAMKAVARHRTRPLI
jgi:CRP-like cAMP-binding protein